MWAGRGLGVIVLACCGLLATGCNRPGGPTIEQILASPTEYEGKLTTVTGTVGLAASLPSEAGSLAGTGGFELFEQPGRKIIVLSDQPYEKGSRVRIKGTVKVISLGLTELVYLDARGGSN